MHRLWGFGVLCVLAACIFAERSRAGGEVVVTLTQDGEEVAALLGTSAADFEQELQSQLDGVYAASTLSDFLKGFANATSFSARGIGADYGRNSGKWMFGVVTSIGIAGELSGDDDAPSAGVAPNLALVVGRNLASDGNGDLTLYVNGFHRNETVGDLRGCITSLGAHLQYKLFKPTSGTTQYVLQWGGIDFTGGIEYSRWGLSYQRPIDSELFVDGQGQNGLPMTVRATGRMDLAASAVVFPLEVTTQLRLATVLTLFGGGGIDVQAGRSTIDASLTGDIRGERPDTGEVVEIGTAAITLVGEENPSAIKGHVLMGLQLNIWKAKLFAQVSLQPVDAAAVAFGLRITP